MDCSTKANDLQLVVSFSAGKNRNVFRRIHIDFFARAASHLTVPPLLRYESHIKLIFSPISHYRRAGRGCLPHAGACASKNGLTIFEIP